jgi:hypothetical protein
MQAIGTEGQRRSRIIFPNRIRIKIGRIISEVGIANYVLQVR